MNMIDNNLDKTNINFFIRAAQESKYNSKLWFRYLRKFITEEGIKFSNEEIQCLLNSEKLTMYQIIILKRATLSNTKTNKKISNLNSKSKTLLVKEVMRRIKND